MNEIETQTESIGVIATLEQMVKVLGFHDLTSFFAVSIFGLLFVAFAIACGVFLVKKRRERLEALNKIVTDVQAEAQSSPSDSPETMFPKETPLNQALPPLGPVEEKREPIIVKEREPSVPVIREEMPVKKTPAAKVITKPAEAVPPKKIDKQPAVKPLMPVAAPKPEQEKVEPAIKKPSVLEPVVAIETPPAAPKADLGSALKNTRQGIFGKLSRFFSRGSEISDDDFEEIETILFTADIGVKTAQKLMDVLRDRVKHEKSTDQAFLRSVLKEEMRKILESVNVKEHDASVPQVLMFVGVNGAGKTTSIGKLGSQLASSGKKVLFGAGDTFRAAATEQLSIWGQRVGAEVVSGKLDSDSASVLFDAIEKAKNHHADYVLCDTAGRLHTKTSLMEELKKVHRVVAKAQTGAPHEVFLVIDATMGQNAITQAREFAAATPLTGVVLSKLDGTAKGGVALGIVDELKVPIRYVGIGEKAEDLRPFDAKLFVDALFEEV